MSAIAIRAARRAAGLCTTCGERDEESTAAGFLTCAGCRGYQRSNRLRYPTAHQKRVHMADELGLCRACIREPRLEGRSRCAGCTEQYRALQRARRDRLAAVGWCSECRKKPRLPGGRRCVGCAETNRERARAGRLARIQQERAA